MSRYYRSFLEQSGPSYTARTTAFATATAITDTTILNALNTFDLGLISNGLDTKMKALYPFVGGTSTTHKYNFMDNSTYQITWSGGITHSTNGVQGNGVNGFGDTNIPVSVFSPYTSVSYGVYSRTNISGGFASLGTNGSDTFNTYLNVSGNTYFRVGGADGPFTSTSDTLGLFIGNRISSSNVRCLSHNTITSKVVSNGGVVNSNILLMQHYGNFSPREYSLYFFADGLTDTNLNDLNTLTKAFQTSLSRQV